MYDILLKNADIYDGSGQPSYHSNIFIKDGVIVKIGDIMGEEWALHTLDVSGFVVSPGFIDPHTHYDNTVQHDKQMTSALCQGVTTVITGACALGTVPSKPEDIPKINQLNSGMVDYHADFNYKATNIDEFLRYADKAAVNVAANVGHIPIRVLAGGWDFPNFEKVADKMKAALRENLDMGAVGFSIGLDNYPTVPEAVSNSELVELASVTKECGAVFVAHVRPINNGHEEVCDIAKKLGVRTHVLHTKTIYPQTCGKPEMIAEIFDRAIGEGADVTSEFYPYHGGETYGVYYLPAWLWSGDCGEMLEKLRRPSLKGQLIRELAERYKTRCYYKPARFGYVKNHSEYEGLSFDQVAELRGQSIGEMFLDVLTESDLEVSILAADVFNPAVSRQLQDDYMWLFQRDYYTIGSDSYGTFSMVHPRAFGAFAKVLRLSREYGLKLETTVHKLTKFNADRYRLSDRGFITEGYAADIVIFDGAKVRDNATFEMPRVRPDGIEWVIVNGRIALAKGCPTGTFAGRSLKKL